MREIAYRYNYLIIGAGLYGATFAHEAHKAGKSVLVIDKRPNIAGNIYTESVAGINVHKYGAHIFHTNNRMWGVVTPQEAAAKIEEQKKSAGIAEPKNLEEQAISLVGTDIYEKLVKGYTEKQWGRPCREFRLVDIPE